MSKFTKTAAIIALVAFGSSAWEHADDYLKGAASAGDVLLWADQTIINTTILMMLTMIAFRRMELIWMPILISVGEAVYDNRILISGLHSLLLEIDTYSDLLGRHATKQVNPQYAMVLAYVIAFSALSAMCVMRARRSFDRMIVVVMAASIMVTFTLFHTFLMVGIVRDAASEGRAIHAALVADPEDFQKLCQTLSLECSHTSFENVRRGNMESVDSLAARTLTDVAGQGARLEKPFIWDGATDDDASRTTFYIIGVGSHSDGFRVARSRENFEAATKFEELRYTSQALAAHSTWMLMACGLMAIHRKHARQKVRRVFSDDSFR